MWVSLCLTERMSSVDSLRTVFVVLLFIQDCLLYQRYSMENPRLCSPLVKPTIKLGSKDDDHGIIVQQARLFNPWSGHKVLDCKFEVKERQKNKIIAVIQKLSFRRDEFGNCIDYVQFKAAGEESQKFCGVIDIHHSEIQALDGDIPKNRSPYTFVANEKGKLEVIIHAAGKKLLPGEDLDLEIVFTSAQDCSSAPPKYSSCGDNNHCIRDEFFGDGFVNCPIISCPDEHGCSTRLLGPEKRGIGSAVTIGAVTAVLTSFLLFFGCIWMSRRYHKLCWSAEFANQRAGRTPQSPQAVHHRVNSRPEGTDEERAQQMTCISLHPATTVDDEVSLPPTDIPNKDLPPSYESLFPGR